METKVLFLLWFCCILGAIWIVIKGENDDV
jgi:hypothetical protein